MAERWRWLYNHSLSITLVVLGILICGVALPFPEGKWFDLISQTGGAFLTAGFINILSGRLVETNRPEKLPPRKKK